MTLRSIRDWHVLKLLTENHSYNGSDLIRRAWIITRKTPPNEIMATVYDVIRRLKKEIECLQIHIVNDRNGNYSIADTRLSQTRAHR